MELDRISYFPRDLVGNRDLETMKMAELER
jgi:hypothetical protein